MPIRCGRRFGSRGYGLRWTRRGRRRHGNGRLHGRHRGFGGRTAAATVTITGASRGSFVPTAARARVGLGQAPVDVEGDLVRRLAYQLEHLVERPTVGRSHQHESVPRLARAASAADAMDVV